MILQAIVRPAIDLVKGIKAAKEEVAETLAACLSGRKPVLAEASQSREHVEARSAM